MDYNFHEKIESLLKSKKQSKKELYDYLGITRQGFDDKLKNNRFTATELGHIAEFFAISVLEFYPSQNSKSEDGGDFGNKVADRIIEQMKELRLQLDKKDEQIAKKDELLASMQNTINNLVGKSEGAPIGQLTPSIVLPKNYGWPAY